MKKLCPECGSNLMLTNAGSVDAAAPLGDAPSHDDQEARRVTAATPGHGGAARGALEEAAALLGGRDGAGGSLGTLAATARQERQLREWAQETGRLISETTWLQHPLVCASSAENEVRFRIEDDRAVKKTHAGTYGFIPRLEGGLWRQSPASPLEYLTRCLLQNQFFGDDLRLEGLCISSGPSFIIGQPAGGISIITSQPWIESDDWENPHPGETEIAERMRTLGFEPIPQSFFGWRHPASAVVLLDAKRDNFILSADGIVPIDLQMTCPPETILSASSPTHSAASAAWRCVNPDCPTEVRARLARWCAPEAMDITGADTLLAPLVRHGLVLDVADFYRLKFGELMELEGMTETAAKDFLAAIAASKTRDWWRLLAGLGISQVDAGVAQSLARAFKNLDDLAGAPLARLTASAGEAVAQSVARWLGERQNRKLIQRLGKAGLF